MDKQDSFTMGWGQISFDWDGQIVFPNPFPSVCFLSTQALTAFYSSRHELTEKPHNIRENGRLIQWGKRRGKAKWRTYLGVRED